MHKSRGTANYSNFWIKIQGISRRGGCKHGNTEFTEKKQENWAEFCAFRDSVLHWYCRK